MAYKPVLFRILRAASLSITCAEQVVFFAHARFLAASFMLVPCTFLMVVVKALWCTGFSVPRIAQNSTSCSCPMPTLHVNLQSNLRAQPTYLLDVMPI